MILQRYLLRDLLKVFLLSLVAVTAVMVVVSMGVALNKGGVPALHVLRVLPQFLPEVLVFTVPATVLFATTLVYGRFARDNEFDAVRMSGVHPLMVVVPALILGTVLSCACLYLTAELVPRCHYRLKYLSRNVDVIADMFFAHLDDHGHVQVGGGRFTVWASSVTNRVARDVYIQKRDRETHAVELMMKAREATFRFDAEAGVVEMEARDAEVRTFGSETVVVRKKTIYPLRLPLPSPPPPGARDLTLGELLRRLRTPDDPGDPGDPDPTEPESDQGLDRKRATNRRIMATEVHLRLNMALSCLSLGLVAVPLALWFRRGHMLAAFLVALGPMLAFHLVMFQAKNLSMAANWPPITSWVANGLLWVIAGVLLWRLFRR